MRRSRGASRVISTLSYVLVLSTYVNEVKGKGMSQIVLGQGKMLTVNGTIGENLEVYVCLF